MISSILGNKEKLGAIIEHLPPTLVTLPSLVYLSIFSEIRIRGLGEIHAISFKGQKIVTNIKSQGISTIGKKVIIRGELSLEENVLIDDECRILIGPVHIGRGTKFMHRSEIVGEVSIGRYCAIARNTVFQAQNHMIKRPSIQRALYSELLNERLPSMEKKGIQIGNDVWVGTRAIILPGVRVGNGAIIGAGSVVTKDVPPYSITAGAPAMHKKFRFPQEIRDFLEDIRWWEWSTERIKRNKKFFLTDLTEVDNPYSLLVD